jgi:ABC-type branched-subunit amino acid transport system substrate-binding protein
MTKINKTSRGLATGAVLASLVALAACSSSGSSSSGSASSSNSGSSAAGEITIMSLATTSSSSGANSPESDVAIRAAVLAANNAGGINGVKVKVVSCNDQSDPNQAAACARQAVADKVAAVIVGYTAEDEDALPIVAAAKIPYIEAESTGTASATNPDAFIVSSGGVGTSMMHGLATEMLGCKTHAVLVNNVPAGIQLGNAVAAEIQAAGGTAVQLQVTPTEADFAPVVATAYSKGAQCFDLVLTLSQSEALVEAVRSSAHPTAMVGAVTAGFPPASLKALGSKADGLILTQQYSSPQPSEVVTDMKAVDPSAPVTTFAIDGWTGAQVFLKAAERVKGTVDAASVLNSLNTGGPISGISTIPTFNPSQPNPVSAFARDVATEGYAFKVVNGELTPLTTLGLLNIQPGYNKIGA